MTIQSENNKRIAKNTLMLYVRMLLGMLVSLYTSRVVLNALGVEDYGIYNIVGSIVVMFSFISSPLCTATQRFYNFELGRGKENKLNLVFNLSLYIYVILAFIMFVIIGWGGSWYIEHQMKLPEGRLDATILVFVFSLFSFLLSLIRTPFESLIIAHEQMSFYAYISIAEILFRLGNAITLLYVEVDKLKLYAVNQFLITVVIFACVYIYCHRHFVSIYITKVWDKVQFKSLLSFSGWTSISSISTIAANQGVNILLNAYCGVIANAAMGIALQLNGVITQLTGNFQTALNPQIVKYYSANELIPMQNLVYRASKLSYVLLFMVVCPLFVHIDSILAIWLDKVPPFTGIFCKYLMVWALLESLMAPLWTSITATGHIKQYHLWMSIIISFVFLLSWLCLHLGFPPTSVVFIKCMIDVVLLAVRLWFVHTLIDFSINLFVKEVIIPVSLLSIFFILIMFSLNYLPFVGWSKFLILCSLFLVCYVPLVFNVVLSKNEQKGIIQFVKSRLSCHY